jgi:hypothetical protein
MRNKLRACLALCIATALAGSAAAGSAAKGSGAIDHIPEFDGPVTTLAAPDGRTWAAWAFRASHEFDIALSSHDGKTTTWSTPVFFGRRSGSDDIDPALAIDSRGALYLAFATSNPPRVVVATLPAGSTTWSEPVVVSGAEAAASPALLIVADRLIVAYRSTRGVSVVQLPTIENVNQIDGMGDGPDPLDYTIKGAPVRPNGPQPASSKRPQQ